jgi:LysM repeat protein
MLATRPPATAPAVRLLGLAAGGLAAAALALALGTRVLVLVRTLTAGPAAAAPDDVVEAAVLSAGVAVLAWLGVSCAVAFACLAARMAGCSWRHGEAWVRRYAPVVVRRALVVAVAAGLGLAGAGAAGATDAPAPVATATQELPADLGWVVPTPTPTPTSTSTSTPRVTTSPAPGDAATGSPAPGPTAATPSAAADGTSAGTPSQDAAAVAPTSAATTPEPASAAEPSALPPTPAPQAETVVVAPGDSLWAIAARHLGAGASDAQIAAEWPAWYAANATTIGDDPGLIHPGQVLTAPAEVSS